MLAMQRLAIRTAPILPGYARSMSTSTKLLVVTAQGPDRVGIVSDITKAIADNSGNLTDSKMMRLGGEFSLLALVETNAASRSQLAASLGSTADKLGLAISLRETDYGQGDSPVVWEGFVKLEGADNPGLVHTVSEFFSSNNINIEKLATERELAPFGGAELFSMEGYLSSATAVDVATLQKKLADLSNKLNVDIKVDDVRSE